MAAVLMLADNTLHPLEIADARSAVFRASELQREVEDALRSAARELANKERAYRQALAERILLLRAPADGEPVAWSACRDIARGERKVAMLAYERDVASGVLEAVRQQAFRRGSDRRDANALLEWSRARDLRTDVTPPDFDTPPQEPRP